MFTTTNKPNTEDNWTQSFVSQALEEAKRFFDQMDIPKTIEVLENANSILLQKRIEKNVDRANLLHFMGDYYLNLNNHQKAIDCNREALDIQIKLLGKEAAATLSSRLLRGIIWERLEKHEWILEDLLNVIEVFDNAKLPISEDYAVMHWLIGRCYYSLRDAWQSILYFQKAAHIFEGLNMVDKNWRPLIYNALGLSYAQAKEPEQALDYYFKALELFLEIVGKNHPQTSMVYTNIALEYYGNNKPYEAVPYFQKSIEALENLKQSNRDILSRTYVLFGGNYGKIGEFEKAEYYLQKGLNMAVETFGATHASVAHAYYVTASMYEAQKDYLAALHSYQKGLMASLDYFSNTNIYHNPNLYDIPAESSICILLLNQKARALLQYFQQDVTQKNRLQAALATIDLGMQVVEKFNYYTDSSKMSAYIYFAMVYETSVKIRYAAWRNSYGQQALEEAFETAEKAKAFLLRRAMQGEMAKAKSPIPDVLQKKEGNYKRKLTELDKTLQNQKSINEEADSKEAKIQHLQVELFEYHQKYNQLMEDLKRDYPDYFQLKYQNQVVKVAEIQELLAPNELMVHYSLYEDSLFVMAVGKTKVVFEQIDRPKDLEQNIEAFEKTMYLSDKEEYIRLAALLYQVLLSDIESELKGKDKLIIVSDGALQRLPFDALIRPLKENMEASNFSELPYLIKDFDIQYHYSATLLFHAHQKKIHLSQKAKGDFLGLAPIKFGKTTNSSGYILKSSTKGEQKRELILKSGNSKQTALMDLEATETEVKTVYKLFEQEEKEAMALFYEMASKENLLQYIEDYQHILLSTHGFSDAKHAALSGLNLFVESQTDGKATPQEEGKLYVSDIMNLQLSAELVVLSSCESGVGKLQNGEGMMSLHRAFLYAGASNIVYSLFKVPQDSTNELIQTLYRCILSGERYSSALRKAKLKLIENQAMEPVDWAGFALIGV